MGKALSERQTRELEFYEEFSKLNDPSGVSFDWISGQETKPWNSYRRLIDIVKQHFSSSDQKLLDFGCGKGEFSVVLSKIGYEVFGFDISPNNIAIAKRLAGKYEMAERTHFQVGVAEKLDYPADYFDVVIGTDILHHVEISQALSECSRVLKKGGIAIFHEPVRVPVFDTLRETRFGKWLVPKEVSLEHHVTQDERKLSADDLKLIRSSGLNCSVQQFLFLSRLERFIRILGAPSFLEKLDYHLFKAVPLVRRFGGLVLIVLGKE
jgi:ubiquinone/menaquinone biosynthesis C-methylase UbiE